MIAPASRKLGKYEIVQKLGRGGMADVYLATDSVLRKTVALKLIEHAADADTCDAIEAEKRGSVLQAHLAAIDHRVVEIYDSGDVDGFFYVAMEYVDGQDLSELMRRGPLAVEFALDVAIAVAQTLEHAHTLHVELGGKEFHGIVHGDIKPKNIRVDKRNQVRVLDFGIAKALSLSRRLTRNEFGSVPYGSPERLEAGEVNELSDLWSLAVMLYEMVTGLQPYQAASTERLERMIRSRIPPPPAPDPCPAPLRRILVKAMAPEAEERYQSAQDLRADLLRFRSGEPVQAMLDTLDVTRRTTPRAPRPAADHEADAHTVLTGPPGEGQFVVLGGETRRTPPNDDTHRGGPADETRRTGPDEGTRRTSHNEAERAPEKPAAAVWGKSKSRTPSPVVSWLSQSLWGRRAVAALVAMASIWVVLAGVSDVVLYRRGAQLERDIASDQVTDPNEIWNRWTELSEGNSSSFLLRGTRKAVEQQLVAAADHVIDAYRQDTIVSEASWKGAQVELAHALTVDPDNTVRGKLRLTEGYLELINSKREKNGQALLTELNQSVEKFTEAEQLMPKSPDPELGLARVYVYGLKDIDKADAALQKAEKLGYPMGNREKAFLADGYRDRADRLVRSSHNLHGLPQEKDQLERAKADYERAIDLYQAIAPYAEANENIVKVGSTLEDVNSRLNEIAVDSGSPRAGNNDPLKNLPHRKVPPWVVSILRGIWGAHGDKQ